MKFLFSYTWLALIFTSCSSTTDVSHRSWLETVNAADQSAYNKFTEIDEADSTFLFKHKVRF